MQISFNLLKTNSNMKAIRLLILFCLVSGSLYAQDTVLEMDVDNQYKENHGPNMRHYGHFYTGVGFVTGYGEKEGSAIDFWRSQDFLFGYRYKLKVLSFYALGFDAGFNTKRYGLSGAGSLPPIASNPLTQWGEAKRHAIRNNSLGIGVYQRINIGKRGTSLGNYIDIGIDGPYNYSVKEVVVRTTDSGYEPAGISRSTFRKLDYYERFTYGLQGRIGIGRFMAYGHYRLSDYFSDKYDIPELPRLTAGLQVVLK